MCDKPGGVQKCKKDRFIPFWHPKQKQVVDTNRTCLQACQHIKTLAGGFTFGFNRHHPHCVDWSEKSKNFWFTTKMIDPKSFSSAGTQGLRPIGGLKGNIPPNAELGTSEDDFTTWGLPVWRNRTETSSREARRLPLLFFCRFFCRGTQPSQPKMLVRLALERSS